MRLGLIVLFVALLLAVVAGQNSLLQPTDAKGQTSAITACAAQGAGCQTSSLGSTPGADTPQHIVFSGGCFRADLHVVRYVPADSPDGQPVVASWCS